MKYHIITFGCQMNKSDSERIAAVLEKNYKKASKIEEADLIVVNMCSVRQSAVDRVYGLIPKFKKLKKEKPLKTVLTGCILKKDKLKFKKKFDFVLDIKKLSKWPQILNLDSSLNKGNYLEIKPNRSNDFSAFIPISNGCNNFCSYCVVPYTRDSLKCRDHKQIIKEAKRVIKEGFKEIWLLGQNVNDYQSPTNSSINFSKLLKAINKIDSKFWLRFTSSNPKSFNNNLINTMASCEKVTPYLNLPLQSGDNKILKKMNRPYSTKQYKDLIKKIREKIPGISLSTDIIVGFPGETKNQFKNTLNLFKELKFDMAYIAQYSPRPQTAASNFKDNVPKKEKKRRERALTKVLKKNALNFNKNFIGKKVKALPYNKDNHFLRGKTEHHKTIKFRGPDKLVGKFVNLKIKEVSPWGLKGKYE